MAMFPIGLTVASGLQCASELFPRYRGVGCRARGRLCDRAQVAEFRAPRHQTPVGAVVRTCFTIGCGTLITATPHPDFGNTTRRCLRTGRATDRSGISWIIAGYCLRNTIPICDRLW